MRSIVIIAIAVASTIAIVFGATTFFVPGTKTLASTESSSNQVPQVDPTASYQKVNVTINGFTLIAAVASTEDQKATGLDVRTSMAEDQGMLFPFADENNYGFWMKGMKFPIDIIWINADKKIVHIEHSLPPCTGPDITCPIHEPTEKAMYVLETTAGFSERHGLVQGTVVQFNLG